MYRLLVISCFTLILTACGRHGNNALPLYDNRAQILLFNGTGVSVNDVAAIEVILDEQHLPYSTVNSSELDGMNQSQLMKYRLLIVPGGNFIDMGKSLSNKTAINIRYGVQHGLNYLGVCAGAFLAGRSTYYNGFNLAADTTFAFYSAGNKGIHKAALAITSCDAPTLDQYWEDGPQLSGWGDVVAKYPDGTPAVTEGKYGTGFIVLTGIHPEAPEDWRGTMTFDTPADVDKAYAAKLIHSAFTATQLPHY